MDAKDEAGDGDDMAMHRKTAKKLQFLQRSTILYKNTV
jgi:hypothetical protein